MKAVILAAGYGTRLQSIIKDIPKPMAKVCEKPFLEYLILYLKKFGIKDIVIAVAYKKEIIIDYFGDGKKWGVNIQYAKQDAPTGSAGAIKSAENYIEDDFLVLNGDSFIQLDINEMIKFHKENNGILSISLREVKNYDRGGFAILDKDKVVSFEFREKSGKPEDGYLDAGVYILKSEIFKYIPKSTKIISFSKTTLPKLLSEKQKIYGFITDGYFIDIGTPESYNKAQVDFRKMEDLWL